MPIFLQPYKKYATFSGRASRAEYWFFYMYFVLATLLTSIVDVVVKLTGGPGELITGLFCLVSILPLFAVTVRRLHDTDRSGWWLPGVILGSLGALVMVAMAVPAFAASKGAALALGLAGLAVLAGLNIAFTVFLCFRGTPGVNNYGEPPQA